MNNLHLVPEIIINVCDRLKANDVRENERQNIILRLEETVKYINASLRKDTRPSVEDWSPAFRETKKARK